LLSFHLAGRLLACVIEIEDSPGASTYNHGVQTSTAEARGANETLGRLEFILVVGLILERTVGVGWTVVESLVDSEGSRDRCRKGEEVGRTHC